ncbi:MAG: peptidylprolyl isomerase, partial [Dehalococcoidia bacterium]|nr:peptidylprolyl isomerase [Dehalococcoidia bacterium]
GRVTMRAALVIFVSLAAAGCGKASPPAPPSSGASPAGAAAPAPPGPSMRQSLGPAPTAPGTDAQVAGTIFGMPVPAGNYYFAKRVAYMFPRPWEEHLTEAERERVIWEQLILHFESFRRTISLADAELEEKINGVLRSQQQAFTRAGDPAAYEAWIKQATGEDVVLFENQMRYLVQIEKLKDQMRQSFAPPVTEEELQQEFLNEQHHVGGEMVVFDTKDEADALYAQAREPQAWEAMKAKGEPPVRPVSLMTLEAYMDLWGIPKAQMYAFHALEQGAVGEPMPFGKQWCVYRLLEKRTGDLTVFPAQRDAYVQQVTARKQHEALKTWIEELKAAADLRILPLDAPTTPVATASP